MAPYIRKRLTRQSPDWLPDGETYFITINTLPRGKNNLAQPSIAQGVRESVAHYQSSAKWHCYLLLLMPDHLHGLFALNTAKHSIRGIVSPWKSYLAKAQSIQWQDGFFEHRIRNNASFKEKAAYIRKNPERAGLLEDVDVWPYCWEAIDFTV